MCNKCENFHSGLFKKHLTYNLDDKKNNDIFNGMCKEKNHTKLEFFCKTHNQLCCSLCITKIKYKNQGKHKDCDICFIKKIKNEKKNTLNENIKFLEELYKALEPSINELKLLSEKLNKNKEEMKKEIQTIFTKLRNEKNKREDELLQEVDKKYDDLFFNKNIIKESIKLPDVIKISIEKCKRIDNKWKDKDKLYSIINDCINIEKKIANIKSKNKCLKEFNSKDLDIKFYVEEKKINYYLEEFRHLGEIIFHENNSKEEQKADIKENSRFSQELIIKRNCCRGLKKKVNDLE